MAATTRISERGRESPGKRSGLAPERSTCPPGTREITQSFWRPSTGLYPAVTGVTGLGHQPGPADGGRHIPLQRGSRPEADASGREPAELDVAEAPQERSDERWNPSGCRSTQRASRTGRKDREGENRAGRPPPCGRRAGAPEGGGATTRGGSAAETAGPRAGAAAPGGAGPRRGRARRRPRGARGAAGGSAPTGRRSVRGPCAGEADKALRRGSASNRAHAGGPAPQRAGGGTGGWLPGHEKDWPHRRTSATCRTSLADKALRARIERVLARRRGPREGRAGLLAQRSRLPATSPWIRRRTMWPGVFDYDGAALDDRHQELQAACAASRGWRGADAGGGNRGL